MPKFILTYARTVILETEIYAKDVDGAMDKAMDLEDDGKLGIEDIEAKENSWVNDISDDDSVWDIRAVL